jgi:hypothetical protein
VLQPQTWELLVELAAFLGCVFGAVACTPMVLSWGYRRWQARNRRNRISG